MSKRLLLRDESRTFAFWLNDLLNGTVTDGVRLEWWYGKHDARVQTGESSIPLALGRRAPRVHMSLAYRLILDTSGRFLTVKSSYLGLFRDANRAEPLLHYDFERDKPDGYPEAHIQVHASSGPWSKLTALSLPKLHLPVGGRRFRPTLEDLIELLIVEELVDARPGWKELVEQGRSHFQRIQLAAAVRSDRSTATDALQDLDISA